MPAIQRWHFWDRLLINADSGEDFLATGKAVGGGLSFVLEEAATGGQGVVGHADVVYKDEMADGSQVHCITVKKRSQTGASIVWIFTNTSYEKWKVYQNSKKLKK